MSDREQMFKGIDAIKDHPMVPTDVKRSLEIMASWLDVLINERGCRLEYWWGDDD